MPTLARITNTFFVNLINRLGVRPPPPAGFELISTVQPVSLVDSDIVLSAVTTSMTLDSANSTGEQVTPAAATVLADTGALNAGNYQIFVQASAYDPAAANILQIARRNSTNTADLWVMNVPCLITAALANGRIELSARIVLSQNERVVVRNRGLGGAASVYLANIWIVAA